MSQREGSCQISLNNSQGSSVSSICCRICQSGEEPTNRLVKACQCSGTIGSFHIPCLNLWIKTVKRDQSQIRDVPQSPLLCEICNTDFLVRKRFVGVKNMRIPSLTRMEIFYHLFFMFNFVVMATSSLVMITFFLNNSIRNSIGKPGAELTCLICGILFFVSFSLIIFTELRAKVSCYNFIRNFVQANTYYDTLPEPPLKPVPA